MASEFSNSLLTMAVIGSILVHLFKRTKELKTSGNGSTKEAKLGLGEKSPSYIPSVSRSKREDFSGIDRLLS